MITLNIITLVVIVGASLVLVNAINTWTKEVKNLGMILGAYGMKEKVKEFLKQEVFENESD